MTIRPARPAARTIAIATAASAAALPRRSDPVRIGAASVIAESRVDRSRSSAATAYTSKSRQTIVASCVIEETAKLPEVKSSGVSRWPT